MQPILSDFSRFPHPLRLSIRPLRRIAGTKSPSLQIAIVIHPSRIRQSADMTMDGDALESRTDARTAEAATAVERHFASLEALFAPLRSTPSVRRSVAPSPPS